MATKRPRKRGRGVLLVPERELFIANGTAKAHVRHVYQKFDIHSRDELFDLIGIDGLQSNVDVPAEELSAGKRA